jgi:glycosyltransferase involved in cell wall biosynthesis
MRIAVYAIALNEVNFIKRWAESAKEADYLLIADTGSTDGTVEIARDSYGIKVIPVHISPWRFDDARNAALAALPPDIDLCIALDMDEVLVEGWRGHLENLSLLTTRPRYKYVWSWNPDGSEGLSYGGDKIHARSGYRWKHPVHEIITSTKDEVQEWCGLEIHHHPDSSKSRSQYFPLLELAKSESPDCDRTAFYYARELFFHGRLSEAAEEFQRHLNLPKAVWRPERAASMRYLAKCGVEPEYWFLRACAEYSEGREPWVDLGEWYYKTGQWLKVLTACDSALAIKDKPLQYLCESDVWGWKPHDLLAVAYWNLGDFENAKLHGILAVDLAPEDERLRSNLEHYLI